MNVLTDTLMVFAGCALGICVALYEMGICFDLEDFDSRVKLLLRYRVIDTVLYLSVIALDGNSLMLQSLYLSKYMYLSVIDYKRTLAID
jgi:hypothetical protein